MAHQNFSRSILQRQKGAVAIEFVFIFPVFFLICYAIIVYGLAFLLVQNFTYASEEVLRAAMACETCETEVDWEGEIDRIAGTRLQKNDTGGLLIYDYTPPLIIDCVPPPTPSDGSDPLDGILCEITISSAPLLDGITMPGFGKLPQLPTLLQGKASLLF
ncbi:hypothetical protein GCM10022414_08860 [Zhongshania borealis]|uniref:TadE-like domain-containing protein n=2 Tax=Zhongshania borealis TaxID=889488 RepID=A0ABP7WGH0_9GAMM